MYRDLALGLTAIAACVCGAAHLRSFVSEPPKPDPARLTRLEVDVAALRARLDASVFAAAPAPLGAAGPAVSQTPALGTVEPARAPDASPPPPSLAERIRARLGSDPIAALESLDREVKAAETQPRALRTALEAMLVLEPSAEPSVDARLRTYAATAMPLVRLHAAKILERRGDRRPLEALVDAFVRDLDSPDHRTRLRAIGVLGYAAEPSSLSALVPLLRDTNSEIRLRAVQALRPFNDRSLARSIAPLLEDPVVPVRTAAAEVLRASR